MLVKIICILIIWINLTEISTFEASYACQYNRELSNAFFSLFCLFIIVFNEQHAS